MPTSIPTNSDPVWLPQDNLQVLIDQLRARGYTVIGPTVDQEAIVYAEISTVDELPRGWTDRQEAGKYRLERRDDELLFGYAVGPHSWKSFLFPAQVLVQEADRTDAGWEFRPPAGDVPRYAFLGVRACELAAIAVQDRTFLKGPYVDPHYQARREHALFIAVQCGHPAATCFCTSMQTGPRCGPGFDLALTELPDGFVVEVGSERGREILEACRHSATTVEQRAAAESVSKQAAEQITKRLNTEGIRDLLLGNLQHPRWDEVASRCLSCTNCTMVCPTCFCCSVTDVADIQGTHVDRVRKWDSCFNVDFSYMNGGNVRDSIRFRYRQWLTHKLASWIDQFGTSGCVGCGRCITWCPVAIDLTEEVAAIRAEGT